MTADLGSLWLLFNAIWNLKWCCRNWICELFMPKKQVNWLLCSFHDMSSIVNKFHDLSWLAGEVHDVSQQCGDGTAVTFFQFSARLSGGHSAAKWTVLDFIYFYTTSNSCVFSFVVNVYLLEVGWLQDWMYIFLHGCIYLIFV